MTYNMQKCKILLPNKSSFLPCDDQEDDFSSFGESLLKQLSSTAGCGSSRMAESALLVTMMRFARSNLEFIEVM